MFHVKQRRRSSVPALPWPRRYAELLADRRGHPRADRPARGRPALGAGTCSTARSPSRPVPASRPGRRRRLRCRAARHPAGPGPPGPDGRAGRAAAAPGHLPHRGRRPARSSATSRWSGPGPRTCTAPGPRDVVTARAVAPLDRLAGWCLPLVAPAARCWPSRATAPTTSWPPRSSSCGGWEPPAGRSRSTAPAWSTRRSGGPDRAGGRARVADTSGGGRRVVAADQAGCRGGRRRRVGARRRRWSAERCAVTGLLSDRRVGAWPRDRPAA